MDGQTDGRTHTDRQTQTGIDRQTKGWKGKQKDGKTNRQR
jgi:hypothetical protein